MLLRNRILLGAATALTVLSLGFLVTGQLTQGQIEARYEDATLTGKALLWSKILASQVDQMEVGLSSLTRDRDTLKALQQGNAEDLRSEAQPTFNRLSTSGVLDRLTITDTQGRILFAEPALEAQTTDNPLVRDALNANETKSGLIKDDDGTLVIAFASPLFVRGKQVGSAVFAREFRAAIEDMKANDGSEIFILDLDGRAVVVTDEAMHERFNFSLPAAGQRDLTTAQFGDLTLAVSVVPLLDVTGTAVGHLVSAKDYTDSYSKQRTIALASNFALALILIVSLLGLTLYLRANFRRLGTVIIALESLSKGNSDVVILGLDRKDEVGEIAKAMEVFRETTIEAQRLATNQAKEQAAREAQAKRVMDLCSTFDKTAYSSLESVASAATEMRVTSESMSATAEETNQQASAVATASEQATANVQTVATAAEEMSASIAEIGRQVKQSATIAKRAVNEAEKTNGTIQGLAEAAQKIGAVVELITGIAEQTNLLALNATIEAARAGDAGKGFAVVASEVKSLANQTARATEEIGQQIAGIQSVTGEAVEAIGSIGETITAVNETATAIAAAVEEQSTATEDIARNVQEVASGTQEVSSNIAGVSQGAEETGRGSIQVLEAAGQLSQQSEGLRAAVDKFLADIKSA